MEAEINFSTGIPTPSKMCGIVDLQLKEMRATAWAFFDILSGSFSVGNNQFFHFLVT